LRTARARWWGCRGLLATDTRTGLARARTSAESAGDDLVLPAGLVAEAPGQAHGPNVAAERPRHAVDPTQQLRRGVVQSSTVANELLGDGEAQVVALVVGGNGGVILGSVSNLTKA
jgi:hypothetical protein